MGVAQPKAKAFEFRGFWCDPFGLGLFFGFRV